MLPSSKTVLLLGLAILALIAIVIAIFIIRENATESSAGIAARVNGRAITESQLDLQYGLLPDSYRQSFTKAQVLDQIIDEEVVVQAAQRLGMNATPQDINERVQAILTQNQLSITDLQSNLAQFNLTPDGFEKLIARQILIDKYLNATIKPAVVDDATLQAIYNSSLSSYTQGEEVTVRHVLIASQRPDAAIIAKRVYDMARNGTDFCWLVTNASDDAGSRGDCGQYTFPRNFMVKEFEDAAFSMKDGEIRLIETQFGYHVIERINMTAASVKPFSEVRPEILSQFETADRQRQYSAIVAGLRDAATIVYANGTVILPHSSYAAATVSPTGDGQGAQAGDAQANAGAQAPTQADAAQASTGNPPDQGNDGAGDAASANMDAGNLTGPLVITTNDTIIQVGGASAPPQVIPPASGPATEQQTQALLSCVAGNATLYGAGWDSDTQAALKLFSDAGVQLAYVACDKQPSSCQGIKGYPTWVIGGTQYLGRMTLDQLKNAAGCA